MLYCQANVYKPSISISRRNVATAPYQQMIDSHCHLDFPQFDHDRSRVIADAHSAGVKCIIIPGTTRQNWKSTIALVRLDQGLRIALGLHPYFLDQHCSEDLLYLQQLLEQQHGIIAIGEIGLDFAIRSLDRKKQLDLFAQQLDIARKYVLPVILHVRKAHDVVIQLLEKKSIHGGTVHAFNGTLQQAERYIDMGFCLGFGGMLTYPHSRKLHKLACQLPRESLVLETDAPDMTGYAHQGQRNSPAYLPEVRDKLAELRHESSAEVECYTTKNARRVFHLPGVEDTG